MLAQPAIDMSGLIGYRQVTDLHLVDLVSRHDAVLATPRRPLARRATLAARRYVELIAVTSLLGRAAVGSSRRGRRHGPPREAQAPAMRAAQRPWILSRTTRRSTLPTVLRGISSMISRRRGSA